MFDIERSPIWKIQGDFSRRYGTDRGENCSISFVNHNTTCVIQSVNLVGSVDGSLYITLKPVYDEQTKERFLATLRQHELPTNDPALLWNYSGLSVTYISPHFRRTTDELFGKIMMFISQLEPSFHPHGVHSRVIQLVNQYANAPETWTASRSPREDELDDVLENINTEDRHLNVGTIGHADHGRPTLTAALTRNMAANLGNPLPFDQAIDANRYQAAGIDRDAAARIASANATISRLMHSIFQNHGIAIAPTKNDFDKAWEFYNEAQFENALACIIKFKTEVLDSNPYPFGHEKAASASKSLDTYRLIANCYRHLHRYNDALNALDQLRNVHHNVLSPASLEQVANTAREWEKEAQEYANTPSQAAAMKLK